MVESEFGNTSGEETCSDNYCTQVTVGDDGAANSSTSAAFGTADYSEPMLEMIVSSGTSSLGTLTTEHVGAKTMSVQIRNYETGGYMLQIIGDTPSYGGHNLTPMTSRGPSEPGTEQFGINVVANTTPAVGTNPKAQPSGTEDLGLLTTDYKVANQYKFVSGDTVALTTSNTGGADYIVTMIVNIANNTPAGHYSGDFAAVVVPYF